FLLSGVESTAHPGAFFGNSLFVLLFGNLPVIGNKRTPIRRFLVTSLWRWTTFLFGLLANTLVFFGHCYSSARTWSNDCCLYSKTSNRAVTPTTLMSMNASLFPGKKPDPYSSKFIYPAKDWVDEHFIAIQSQLTELVAHQSLAFDEYDRAALRASAYAIAELFSDVGLQELHQVTEIDDADHTS